MAIVADGNINRAYIKKVSKYWTLQERVRRERNLKFVRIIPVIITINGFIHKKSIAELKQLNVNLSYPIIIKNLLIQEIKHIMYYVTNEMMPDIEVDWNLFPQNATKNHSLMG